jgi:murein DD-endopeptidase MepM/ murein hydrolase activator NlpD
VQSIRKLLTGFLVFVCSLAMAQPATDLYPPGYFRNPLNLPMSLSGNFGELRPNHFHMGLDLKTNGKENQPVFAAADGFISRIKIEPAGFGQAIYIDHPNGYTTVYAHLNHFIPAIEAYVKKQQYLQQSWDIMLTLTPDIFPVKKGDLIAYSGNTGGSQAPHLHFEVRKTDGDINVNPMLFSFPIPDETKPRILRLAIYDRNKSVYEQSPRLIPVKAKSPGNYVTSLPVITVSSPKISFAISAFDTHTGSSNMNGIYSADVYKDDVPVAGFVMNNISYEKTRYLNAHIDYRFKMGGGAYLQHLSQLPGYTNSIYTQNGNGIIDISDRLEHNVEIIVKDPYGNTSKLSYRIIYSGAPAATDKSEEKLFYPGMLDGLEADSCAFYIGENCLNDQVHIHYGKTTSHGPGDVSAANTIGSYLIPVQDSFLVQLLPDARFKPGDEERTVMQCVSGSKTFVEKVQWNMGWASARFRDFGTFKLIVDTVPPTIVPVGFANGSNLSKASHIVFNVKDNLGTFKHVRAELDGAWLRFSNDKGTSFIYRFDEKCLAGEHELLIYAEDEAGNSTQRKFSFVR